jgi:hypothetical protein
VPIKIKTTPKQRRAAIAQWRQRSRGLSLGGLNIFDLTHEGRR